MSRLSPRQDYRWTLGAAVLGTVTGLATRRLLAEAWEATQDAPPPDNPGADDVTWKDAMVWAAISGLTVAMARVVAKRTVAHAWETRHEDEIAEWRRSKVI